MENRNFLFMLLLCFCICSCQKKYRYIEIVNEKDIVRENTLKKRRNLRLLRLQMIVLPIVRHIKNIVYLEK